MSGLKIDSLDVTLSVAKGLAGLGLHLLRCFPSALPAEQAGWFRTGASLKHGSFHASVVRPKRMTTAVMWRVLVLILYLGLASGCNVLQGQVLENRPEAPDFVLTTTRGERCALSDMRGSVVLVYMTNL